jgi:hypothetical protein
MRQLINDEQKMKIEQMVDELGPSLNAYLKSIRKA